MVFWIPSFFAPDLWIAWISSFWIKLLQRVIPREMKKKKHQSISLGWSKVNAHLESDKLSTEKEYALRFFYCCSCLCLRLRSDNIFLSVLAPQVEDANYELKNEMRAPFEAEPSIVELMKLAKQAPDDPALLERMLKMIDFARWKNHSRYHELPSYLELLLFYGRKSGGQIFPVLLSMGIFNHLRSDTGKAIVEQILANYAVFFTSALGWLNKYTQPYYGIEETVEI